MRPQATLHAMNSPSEYYYIKIFQQFHKDSNCSDIGYSMTTILMYQLWISYRKDSVPWLAPGVHSHQHETSAATDNTNTQL